MRSARSGVMWALLIGAGLLVAVGVAVLLDGNSERPSHVTRAGGSAGTSDGLAESEVTSREESRQPVAGEARDSAIVSSDGVSEVEDAQSWHDEERETAPDAAQPAAIGARSASNAEAEYASAIAALQDGDPEGAAVGLEALLDAFRADPVLRAKVRTNLARAHLAMNDRTRASGETEGALRTPDASVEQPAADAKLAASHRRRALALTEEAVTLDARSDGAWNVRGLAFLSANRGAEAVAAFEEAVEINPDNLNAQNNLGYVRILRGEAALALAPLRAARDAAERLGVDLPAHVFNNLGVALESTGALEEAREAFRQAAASGHANASVSLARVDERLSITNRHASAESLTVLEETARAEER